MSRTPQGSQSLGDDLNDDNQTEPGELSWFAKKRYSNFEDLFLLNLEDLLILDSPISSKIFFLMVQ